jgi:NOL1/NOP2/sun family putative RNA methylase
MEISGNISSYLHSLYGKDSVSKYLQFMNERPAVYIRVNTLKCRTNELRKSLFDDYGIETEELPSFPFALKIKSGFELIGKTIEHITGLYYLQGLSSMFPPLVLNPSGKDKVLDLCASPGSKTTQLASLMNNEGMLVANEVNLDRVKTLVFNLDRMNVTNTGVVHYKGEWLSKFFNEYFDKVLVDAPCSGLGIIQKKSEISKWWSLERVNRLAELQLKLLIAAVKMTKPGGTIVYSTCTLTAEENESVINKVLKKYPVELADIDLRLETHKAFSKYNTEEFDSSIIKAKRIIPWETDTDGFFIAKLIKIGETLPPVQIDMAMHKKNLLSLERNEIKSIIHQVSDVFGIAEETFSRYKYLIKGSDVFFISGDWENHNLELFNRIGIKFGTIDKRGDFILHTNAAQILSDKISKNVYEIEDNAELKTYLDGSIIKKEDKRKQLAIKYKNFILGTAVVTAAGIKSRFPRSKRTQEILTEF